MGNSRIKMVRDTIIYTLLPKFSIIATLLITPVISPYLTLADFGIHGLIIAYLTVLQTCIVLGQNVILQNSFFEYPEKYALVWRRCFGLMTFAGMIGGLIFFVISFNILKIQIDDRWLIVATLVSIYLIFSPIETIAVNYYILKERPVPYTLCSVINGVTSALVSLVAIKYFNLGYLGWIIVMPVNGLINYLYYFKVIIIREKIYPYLNLKKDFILHSLKVGLPLMPHQISLYILSISDRLLLEYFKVPIGQLGFYSQGYNVGSNGSFIVNGVFQAFSKRLQEGFRGNEPHNIVFIKNLMLFIPVAISFTLFIVSMWSKELFMFLFRNPELQKAYPVTIIVICSYMFWSVYSFFIYPLSIKKQTFSISKITVIAASFNIIGNIILIPFYGIWAATGVTYFAYIIFGIAGLFNKENRIYLNKYVNTVKLTGFLLIINFLLFTVSYASKDSAYYVKALLSGFAIFTVFVVYKLIYRPKENLVQA